MTIQKEDILLEVVRDNPLLASVVDRFGISYSRWVLPIEQACATENTDPGLLIEMLRIFSDKEGFPVAELNKLPLQSIIEYLIKTHVYYIKHRLPRLEQYINLLTEQYGKFDIKIYLLKDYFSEYKRDMLQHIRMEERQLFPYVLRLINAKDLSQGELFNLLNQNAISEFLNEHFHIEDELGEMRRRINNYSTVHHHQFQTATLLQDLRLFEIDLLAHDRIEDEVLIPRARAIESALHHRLREQAYLN